MPLRVALIPARLGESTVQRGPQVDVGPGHRKADLAGANAERTETNAGLTRANAELIRSNAALERVAGAA